MYERDSMSRRRKMVTIVDVAKQAGVSIGTVSNVLNGTGRVAADTIKHVQKTMEELDFQPNDMARGLRVVNSRLIGFIIPDMTEFYMKVAKSFMQLAYESDYTVLLADYDYSLKREQSLFDSLIKKRSEIIVVLGGFFDDEYLKEQSAKGTKILLLDRRIKDANFSTIEFDNISTMRRLIGQLKKSGYNKIGYISETISMSNLEDRYQGFLQGLHDNQIPLNENDIYICSELQLEKRAHAYKLMTDILNAKDKKDLPEVFITSADNIAVGAMDAIKDFGYRIPDDIAIVGFDNSLISEYVTPHLTTINQNTEQMGTLAWNIVKDMIHDKVNIKRNVYLEQDIVFRGSCKVIQNTDRKT